ncbi:MAG TPA: phenylacetate-CoA oxygenase subunit PaaC [Gammaproteobacteria bacterium]|nr:phenylacetate-CoA oxygenase subunit PaaC [Gammaproteobacteria bacterium]
MSTPQANDTRAALAYVLRIADGSLILGQRLGEWCGHGPVLEEDIAFTNVALDLIGQARLLLTHAGRLEDRGRDEDALAFLREEHEFLNPTLVELPNGDFAQSVLRTYFYVAWQQALWSGLVASRDPTLAAIAGKSRKETRYHVEHLGEWVLRLGDGTPESHARMQRALDYLLPYAGELFVADEIDAAAAAAGLGPAVDTLRAPWEAAVHPLLAEATLALPGATPFRSQGRRGRHSEFMGFLLAEMQSLARAHPGAVW